MCEEALNCFIGIAYLWGFEGNFMIGDSSTLISSLASDFALDIRSPSR
jgi:hypothetical protein